PLCFRRRIRDGKTKTPPERAAFLFCSCLAAGSLLDLCFLELDVLLRDRIVLTLGHLFGHRAAVLRGDVEEPRVRGRKKLDLDGRSLGHFSCPPCLMSGRRFVTGGRPDSGKLARRHKRGSPKVKAGTRPGLLAQPFGSTEMTLA